MRTLKLPPIEPRCPYCGHSAELVTSAEVYPRAIQDYGQFWMCWPCNAYVGCHKNSRRHAPLGRLANAELRDWKKKAHAAFDPVWRESDWTRDEGYKWLTGEMGRAQGVHIGFMDVSECRHVVNICTVDEKGQAHD